MPHTVESLCKQFADLVISVSNTGGSFARIDSAKDYAEDSLIFVADAKDLAQAPAAVVVTSEEVAAQISDKDCCVVVVSNVRLAQARIKQEYQDYDASDSEWPQIHPAAVVHSSAELAPGVRIGPNSVIGAGVSVGAETVVRANCVIEHGAQIGAACVINNLVNIGYDCIVGDRVILRPGVIIGNEGFGFGQDSDKRYHRIPHTGIVEVQDDVSIGANCNIDRGTYGKTVIARGVKIDALCHVGHNVLVDEDALFVAQTGVAGSSKVGRRAVLSGQTGVIDHCTIADDVVLVHRGGVIEDIPTAGVWAGTPAKPFREYVRGLNLEKKVEKLSARLKQLEKDRS